MAKFKKTTGPDDSSRAPRGVCEIAIQIFTHKAFDMESIFSEKLEKHAGYEYNVEAYESTNGNSHSKLMVYTGTDRLGISELRNIAELYSMTVEFDGNIPPNMSIFAAQNELDNEHAKVWLQFKTEMEIPTHEVENLMESDVGDVNLTPKNPMGDDMLAIQFRDINCAYDTVRDVVERSNSINDNAPVEHINLVCET